MNYYYLHNSLSKKTPCLSIVFVLLQLMINVIQSKIPPTIPFQKGFTPLFGDGNLIRSSDDNSVKLLLNQYTGSGFKSSDLYSHGLFSAKIKLPSTHTAGIVVAFYTTNGDMFEKAHDELDFEFLGNIKGSAWRFQTNLYGNGSTSRGREERYFLWFDPTKEFHRYSILWTANKIVFYIDDIPIREIIRNEEMAADYPSKPMSLYATIWDASDWATSGGKYKVNYKYAPFIAEFTDLTLHGCSIDPLEEVSSPSCEEKSYDLDGYAVITPKQQMAMKKFRQKYMYYSYCYDKLRYPTALAECVVDPLLRQQLKDNGRLKFGERHHSRSTRSKVSKNRSYDNQDDV